MISDEVYKKELNSQIIAGQNELIAAIKNMNRKCFMPGERSDKNVLDSHDFRYLKSGEFQANMHVHTKYSDGLINVEKLLNHSTQIANRNKKKNTPFILAVTDHDTLEGSKAVLKLLQENPEKYKNLKVVLGLEISTVGVNFKNQKAPVSIHLLTYCINPYDKKLNEFIDSKRDLKLKLAYETIANLNKELSQELGFEFTIDEAALVHEMIKKGQDEVCHPLEKYTAGKILFNYYIKDADFTYEKPVQKFKYVFRNNQPYYKNYKKALELYIGKELEEIPDNIKDLINKAIEIYTKSEPLIGNIQDAFSSFEETVKFISELDYGIMSIAHPARIRTKNFETSLEEFYTNLFSNYKLYGSQKACFYEGYYQSYEGENSFKKLPNIDKSAQKFNLIPTGGMDSHGPDVITRCPYS